MPADINPDQYASLVEVFERSCQTFAPRLAFVNMDYGMTFAELDQKSRAFAAWLQQDLGLVKGERVAIMLPNLLQYPVVLFGVLRAGLIAVNVNPLYTHANWGTNSRIPGPRRSCSSPTSPTCWPR